MRQAQVMDRVAYTSALGEEHRDALERLLFFNENQARASEGVAVVVERYGIPRITRVDRYLRVEVASGAGTQALFVVDRAGGAVRPVGVVVYTREDSALVVLFVAVHEEYALHGSLGGAGLTFKMIAEIGRIAATVRGVDTLLLYLGRRAPTRISVASHKASDKASHKASNKA